MSPKEPRSCQGYSWQTEAQTSYVYYGRVDKTGVASDCPAFEKLLCRLFIGKMIKNPFLELLTKGTWLSSLEVLKCYLLFSTCTMKVSDEDSSQTVRLKTAFMKDLSKRQATRNHQWLKVATALNGHFKNLKCLQRGEQEGVWTSLKALLQEESNRTTPELTEESPKRKHLLLFLQMLILITKLGLSVPWASTKLTPPSGWQTAHCSAGQLMQEHIHSCLS